MGDAATDAPEHIGPTRDPPASAPGAPAPGTMRRWARSTASDGAVLFGIAGLAVTQPLLALFGDNPTFFVAGGYTSGQIITFALVIALVPAATVLAITSLTAVLGHQVGRVAHACGVGLFGILLGLQLCRLLEWDAVVVSFVAAAVLGAGIALAQLRWEGIRRLLTYLAFANIVFVGLFLFTSPSSALLGSDASGDVGDVTMPPLDGPVTVVVLDEFPLQAVIRPDGTINATRYPHLAALADTSTWFRDAAAENLSTYLSVPSILTGRLADEDALPTHQDHPRNLFTLFGRRYPINRYEVVTDLCPGDICEPPPPQPLSQALDDAGLVFRHRLLPEPLRVDLPAIDQDWGDFGNTTDDVAVPPPTTPSGEVDPLARLDEVPEADRGRAGQLAALERQIGLIDDSPSLNLIHVLHPHHPYYTTPWGVESTNEWLPDTMPRPGDPGYERAFLELYGQQAMQIGALDEVLGAIVAELQAADAWDRGTFVLVSDHGVDITPPVFGRVFADDTQDELLRVPLMIKAPGQTEGVVRDEPASTIDVLPSLIDLLDIEVDWEMDGRSLFDGSEPTAERRITTTLESFLAGVERRQEDLPPGDDWWSTVAIGDHGDLVGSAVDDHGLGAVSQLTWTYGDADALRDPAGASWRVPVGLRGTVTAPPATAAEPPELVVALDGIISGTIGGYRATDGAWDFTGLLGPTVEGGAQEVVAYEVEETPDGVLLRPLGST